MQLLSHRSPTPDDQEANITAREHSREKARETLERFAAELADVAEIEREPVIDGRVMTMTLKPKKTKTTGRSSA